MRPCLLLLEAQTGTEWGPETLRSCLPQWSRWSLHTEQCTLGCRLRCPRMPWPVACVRTCPGPVCIHTMMTHLKPKAAVSPFCRTWPSGPPTCRILSVSSLAEAGLCRSGQWGAWGPWPPAGTESVGISLLSPGGLQPQWHPSEATPHICSDQSLGFL